ncbi:hypothetical protein [Rossellomorea aquimaris]|uniref:Uncharacterized protein n=1 Tax=Rossellomorea aquimaris TaxID=189382 RepID=A0A366EV03_9BACI|nr:hypothetical protein [Rossellomorea aquimaris]RBP06212.1 hypothetical protein DET59_103344 [Rossellomorea aquimaris]
MKDKKGTNILIFVGWLSVILAFFTPWFFHGFIAFCVGLVLKKDYEKKRYGMFFMVLGIMSEILPHVIGFLLIGHLDKAL